MPSPSGTSRIGVGTTWKPSCTYGKGRAVSLISQTATVSAFPSNFARTSRVVVGALVCLHRSRLGRWTIALGSGAVVLALAAGNGGAALIGMVLPGRFDDAMRVAVVRRYPPCPAGVRSLCLSLVMLGFIDCAALAPLAFAAAVVGGAGTGVRAGLLVVAVAGVAAATLIVALPRLVGSERALRFRLGGWLSPRTTSLRRASQAWVLVSACWLVRAVALFLLLGALGVGYSVPLALLFLCAGAAAAALPIGPAGTATQVGAGAGALLASGVGASQALSVAVSVGTLGVLSGTAILLFAIAWRTGLSFVPARAVAT